VLRRHQQDTTTILCDSHTNPWARYIDPKKQLYKSCTIK